MAKRRRGPQLELEPTQEPEVKGLPEPVLRQHMIQKAALLSVPLHLLVLKSEVRSLPEVEPEDYRPELGEPEDEDQSDYWGLELLHEWEELIKEPIYLSSDASGGEIRAWDEPLLALEFDSNGAVIRWFRPEYQEYLEVYPQPLRLWLTVFLQELEQTLTQRRTLLECYLRSHVAPDENERFNLLTIRFLAFRVASDLAQFSEMSGIDPGTIAVWISNFANANKIQLPNGWVRPLACFFTSGRAQPDRNMLLLELTQEMWKQRGDLNFRAIAEQLVAEVWKDGPLELKGWIEGLKAKDRSNSVAQQIARVLERYWERCLKGRPLEELEDPFDRCVAEWAEQRWARRRRGRRRPRGGSARKKRERR